MQTSGAERTTGIFVEPISRSELSPEFQKTLNTGFANRVRNTFFRDLEYSHVRVAGGTWGKSIVQENSIGFYTLTGHSAWSQWEQHFIYKPDGTIKFYTATGNINSRPPLKEGHLRSQWEKLGDASIVNSPDGISILTFNLVWDRKSAISSLV